MTTHRFVPGVVVLCASLCSGMDGIAVTALDWRQNYSGTQSLNAYTITNDQVTGTTVLASFTNTDNEWGLFYSPSINPSGTHVVFVRSYETRFPTRHTHYYLSTSPISGGGYRDICEMKGLARNLWWLNDGTIAYGGEGGCYLRKVTVVKNGSQAKAYEDIMGVFDYYPQGCYVDVSLTASLISYRIYGTGCFGKPNLSTQTTGPIPADTAVHMSPTAAGFWTPPGCGNAVSPLGEMSAYFGGSGHEATVFVNNTSHQQVFTFRNVDTLKAWCEDQFPDSVQPGGAEEGQGWSVNSTKWSVVSLGCKNRFAANGSDMFLINWQERKCIDVTKHCVNATVCWAQRGDLWVSSQAEVDQTLWSYVSNRDQEGAAWSAVAAALPDSAVFADTTGTPSVAVTPYAADASAPQLRSTIAAGANGLTLTTASSGAKTVRVFDAAGACVFLYQGANQRISVPSSAIAAGLLLVRVEQRGRVETVRCAVAR